MDWCCLLVYFKWWCGDRGGILCVTCLYDVEKSIFVWKVEGYKTEFRFVRQKNISILTPLMTFPVPTLNFRGLAALPFFAAWIYNLDM